MGTLYTALELGIALGSVVAGIGVARAGFTMTFLGAAGLALAMAALAATRLRHA
jgi:predicted MFS family arabinose efflux permease